MPDSYTKLAASIFGDVHDHPLFHLIPESDRQELSEHFALIVAKDLDNYADTFRITPTDVTSELNLNDHLAKQSCCGIYDTSVRCTSGNYYLIGFNYGH